MEKSHLITGVDCHAHVINLDLPLITDSHSRPICDANIEEFLSILSSHQISHGVLSAPSFYGNDNSLLLHALQAYPQNLRGTVIIDPNFEQAVVESQLLNMRERGVVGIRLNWLKMKKIPDINSKMYKTLLGIAKDLNFHIELFIEDHLQERIISSVLASGATVVLDHFGNPNSSLGIDNVYFQNLLKNFYSGKVWVKLSAPYRLGLGEKIANIQPFIDSLITVNPERLVWASDWPWVSFENKFTYADCIAWIKSAIQNPVTWDDILVNNPKSLYRF